MNSYLNKTLNNLLLKLPQPKKLLVLMYHKISIQSPPRLNSIRKNPEALAHKPDIPIHNPEALNPDSLSISLEDFQRQMLFLKNEGFTFLNYQNLLDNLTSNNWPDKCVFVTFDDGYQNNVDYLFPWVSAQKIPVMVFLPLKYLNKKNIWDGGNEDLIKVEDVHYWHNRGIQFGIHSYAHQNFKQLTELEIEQDLKLALEFIESQKLPIERTFAYPYGGLPKDSEKLKFISQALCKYGIQTAFRIGNRHNNFPIQNRYSICRLDIKGNQSFSAFVCRVRLGKIAAHFL
jgi:peptidoglycan/xylan/chitin deacetylase (PgdA/CDA1 family)